ncbi:MAG: hypothetical protein ACFFAA_10840 [Promethearchaeota archaeon]
MGLKKPMIGKKLNDPGCEASSQCNMIIINEEEYQDGNSSISILNFSKSSHFQSIYKIK